MLRMARRRSSAARIVRVSAAPRAASPIIRIAQPRAAPARRKGRRRGRRSGARSILGGAMGSGVDVALGGALFGFAVKSGWVQKLPAVPLLGRTGTAAILLHFWAKRGGGPWVAKAANAAAVLAGYQLGSTGAITGGLQTTGSAYGDEPPYTDGDDEEEED